MFYPEEMDICPAFGWQGGPSIDVLIKRLVSGREKRKPQSFVRLHSYVLPFQNVTDMDYLNYVKSAFMALGGPTDSFLVKDYSDFLAVNEPLGLAPAGSTPVQLLRTYSFGAASHSRTITKPLAGAVISQNGTPKAGTLDTLTGLFTPTTPWTPAAVLAWDGEFRVPVRFDQMTLMSTVDNKSGLEFIVNGSATLLEVIEE